MSVVYDVRLAPGRVRSLVALTADALARSSWYQSILGASYTSRHDLRDDARCNSVQ
jgi:hypothetical protein